MLLIDTHLLNLNTPYAYTLDYGYNESSVASIDYIEEYLGLMINIIKEPLELYEKEMR